MRQLLKHCSKELNRWRVHLQTLDHEGLVVSALNMALYQIYVRNKDNVSSLKFSDFLKEEHLLDHYFFRVCRELESHKLNPRVRFYGKKKTKSFGLFDVSELEAKPDPSLEINPTVRAVEEFKEPFPWEIRVNDIEEEG